jgi:hypothetical protein
MHPVYVLHLKMLFLIFESARQHLCDKWFASAYSLIVKLMARKFDAITFVRVTAEALRP